MTVSLLPRLVVDKTRPVVFSNHVALSDLLQPLQVFVFQIVQGHMCHVRMRTVTHGAPLDATKLSAVI